MARQFGATTVINSGDGKAIDRVMEVTSGEGVDVAIEAVGVPATFDICQGIIAPGGRIANVGVHGKPVTLHLETLWSRNMTLTTRLVDTVTTPMLLKVVQSGRLEAGKLVTHRFALDDILKAYRHVRARLGRGRTEGHPENTALNRPEPQSSGRSRPASFLAKNL